MDFTDKWAKRDWQKATALRPVEQARNELFYTAQNITPDIYLAREAAAYVGASVNDVMKWIAEK